jgi:signal transduction histidine kinase
MAVPSFIKPLWSERRINQHHGFSIPEVQQPPESEKGALPAPRTDAIPPATLAQVAQFLEHDFRHHLSTVYANAEFLCSRTKHSVDKDDLLGEIRSAIGCMTDQLDSLLLCTRTGHTMQPRRESLRSIIDQAVQLVRSHPETRHVTFIQHDIPALEGWMDGTKLCSAVFNLLLNACQAANVAAEVKWVLSRRVAPRKSGLCVDTPHSPVLLPLDFAGITASELKALSRSQYRIFLQMAV